MMFYGKIIRKDKDMSSSGNANSGISFSGALFLVFLVLKLTKSTVVATWSWWWITSPLWIPFVILGIILVVIGCVILLKR
jgi:hypothetical protein